MDDLADPELDALLAHARRRAERNRARLKRIDVESLPAHRRLAYADAVERVRQVLRLTDADVVASIQAATLHADRELTVPEIMMLLAGSQ